MFPAFVPIVAWITLVAVLITIWWLRRRRDQETMRAFAAPKPPPAIPGSPPRCVEVETDSGTIRVTHLVFSSDVPEGGGEREMQAGWDFAVANKAYRILIDLPPFGGSSRRFFQAMQLTGFCAGSGDGLLVIRHHPPMPGGSNWFAKPDDGLPYYLTVPARTPLEECLKLTATATPMRPPPPPDYD